MIIASQVVTTVRPHDEAASITRIATFVWTTGHTRHEEFASKAFRVTLSTPVRYLSSCSVLLLVARYIARHDN